MILSCGICHVPIAIEPKDEAAAREQLARQIRRVGDPDLRNYLAVCGTCSEALIAQGALDPAVGV